MHAQHTPRLSHRTTLRVAQLACALALSAPAWAQVATDSAPMASTGTAPASAGFSGSFWSPGSARTHLARNSGHANFRLSLGSHYTSLDK